MSFIKNQGTADPTHVAVRGSDFYRTDTDTFFINVDGDTDWQPIAMLGFLTGAKKGTNEFGFRAHRTANQNDIVTATWTKVQLNAEGYDPLGDFDHVTLYRFVCSEAGKYLLTSRVQYGALADTEDCQAVLKLNNTTNIALDVRYSGASDHNPFVAPTTIYSLAVDDYIELFTYHTHGSNRNITGSIQACYLAGQLIGE